MATAIFLDGESKGGKTAVGRAIAEELSKNGLVTKAVIAGHFFRRLTLLALRSRPVDSNDNSWLEAAVEGALKSDELYNLDYNAAELDSPEVDSLVSSVGQLDIAQRAAGKWRVDSAERALGSGAQVILFDGRNLRKKLSSWLENSGVNVALELVIYCNAAEAARRYLADNGNASPSKAELDVATEMIEKRRRQDRTRKEAAYVDPADPVKLVVGRQSVTAALEQAYGSGVANPPRPILFDNSEVPRCDGLATVSQLAALAVSEYSTITV